MKTYLYLLIGLTLDLAHRGRRLRDERGVSQSTEQAILLACAAAVALAIVGVVTALVQSKLAAIPK
ncbi:hypothetical protein G7070_08445 [Propioniciclava coleopterorum]|uniref:Uncharacterized protein n=1 Tax=Propioniciclava coleopterorum TaxID=2714937 RepID=A0A6G7Y668_9ACTN|nr:hypothetical protein [Propioniciclava coleopterorum]QIK72290.1 hypothetical protein G7070_08445 [Propioniciclava coleopterorum]